MIDFQSGAILLVDKPKGWTSFDVCNKLRGALRSLYGVKKFKIGHSGTLDPLATGLLILATGPFTKKLHDLQGLDKGYDGHIKFGATTPSYDAELPEEDHRNVGQLSLEKIRICAMSFLGESLQVPPIYSAIKKDGKPAYKVARAKGELKLDPRPIRLDAFDIQDYAEGISAFACQCSKGTYIRSLAHDLGEKLGTGAYLWSLRRTSIGEYQLSDAKSVDEWLTIIHDQRTNKSA